MSHRSNDAGASGPVPTQVANSNRATIRTAFQMLVGLASVLPLLLAGTGLDVTLIGGQVIVVSMAVTRIMNMPQVNAFIDRFVPWLATEKVKVM